MILADGNCEEETAQWIYQSVAGDLAGGGYGELDSQFVELIYNTSFGSLNRAEQVADALVAQAMLRSPRAASFKSLRYSAFAYRRAGKQAKAITTMSTALEVADRCRLNGPPISAVEGLVQCFLDVDDHTSALRYLQFGKQRLAMAEDIGIRCSLLFAEAEIKLASGESPSPELLRDQAFASLTTCRTARVRLSVLAMLVGIHATNKGVVPSDLLDELLALHLAHRSRGGQDFVSHSLYLGLRASDREIEGRALVTEYLRKFRRDRGAPPARLQELAEASGETLSGTTILE
jgi:hypothetical protein